MKALNKLTPKEYENDEILYKTLDEIDDCIHKALMLIDDRFGDDDHQTDLRVGIRDYMTKELKEWIGDDNNEETK